MANAIVSLSAIMVLAANAAAPELSLPGKQFTSRTVDLETKVACAPAESYEMWATTNGVKKFFAPEARIAAEPGGEYTVMFFPESDPEGLSHGTKGAHLLAADPGRFFAFEWIVFAGDHDKGRSAPPYATADLRAATPLPTWVEIHFEPVGPGTHVRLRHYGFLDGELWAESHAWFTKAWSGVLEQMKDACDPSSQ